MAQRAASGEGDDVRDPEAITEGFRLNRNDPNVSSQDLVAVAESYGADWGEVVTAADQIGLE